MAAHTIAVEGMTCRNCEVLVSEELEALPGVTMVAVDLAAGTVTVEAEETLAELHAAIELAGYGVTRAGESGHARAGGDGIPSGPE
ncbi:cation transporter [Kribbella sp. NBC_01245]|uniref:heavy-metal-associated domain-containing protein n=1 Tax=Kribbella sp. NBC_01245 TaxID=2903578 RepID=UPI002E2E131C|nr:cation transporter [Kribbella sp. NBC_01245]